MTYDNTGNFNLPPSNPPFIHYLFNLLSIHIFVLRVWQHNPCQLLSLGLMWPQCLIQPSSIPFHPIFLSQKPPSSAITGWLCPLAQPTQHKQVFSVAHKVGVWNTFPLLSLPTTLHHSITNSLLVRHLLICKMWVSWGEGKTSSFYLALWRPSSQSLKTSASSIESIRHKALWESWENTSHWLICSPGSQRTRTKLYIVMAFIKPNSVLGLHLWLRIPQSCHLSYPFSKNCHCFCLSFVEWLPSKNYSLSHLFIPLSTFYLLFTDWNHTQHNQGI